MNAESGAATPVAAAQPAAAAPLRRFPDALEAEFAEFHLRQSCGGIRAWHTMALAAALLVIVLSAAADIAGRPALLPWMSRPSDPLLIVMIVVSTGSRALLTWLAWSAGFARLYPRLVFPLALICHASLAVLFSNEIFGPHPGYLAVMATYMFAACFLTGLTFRQAMWVNGAAMTAFIAWAWHAGTPLAGAWSGIFHALVTLVTSAIGAAAVERSSRTLFMEHKRVGEMAARDGLTGLKNRRAFDDHLLRVWQQALRDRRCLAVLLIDVDYFKAYNDHFGHQAGDEALRRIADVVQSMARRPLDLAARYGGEELAIILFDLSKPNVIDVAERVQRAVQALQLSHPGSGVAPHVTVSTGVAFVRPTLERTPQGALQLADRGLYAAKRSGRNRIVTLDRDLDPAATDRFVLPRVHTGAG